MLVKGVMRRGSGTLTAAVEGVDRQMTESELNRLRWQCRRGVLELDLVLERFLEKHGDRLEGEALDSFRTLLTYADNDILDLIRGRGECRDARIAELVQRMRD